MQSKGKITVMRVRQNEAYDIYRVTGVDNPDEEGEPIYHKELRGNGSTEESVLSDYLD